MSTTALQVRRLTYADLPRVIAIERRAFPPPGFHDIPESTVDAGNDLQRKTNRLRP